MQASLLCLLLQGNRCEVVLSFHVPQRCSIPSEAQEQPLYFLCIRETKKEQMNHLPAPPAVP